MTGFTIVELERLIERQRLAGKDTSALEDALRDFRSGLFSMRTSKLHVVQRGSRVLVSTGPEPLDEADDPDFADVVPVKTKG